MTWAYIAGFFDGEGSITNNGKGFRITIAQTNQEVLEKIRDFVGAGYVIAVAKRREHWKDSWVYYISSQQDILRFLLGIFMFLVVKKKLAVKTIPILETVVKKQKERQIKNIYLIQNSKKLREDGLTYREIGRKLGIDFGHARRLTMK